VPELPPQFDDFQQDPGPRNNRLVVLLGSTWLGFQIKAIRRDPPPTNPPDLQGPTRGAWIAEVVVPGS
jgi:hypothetical protein